MKRILKQLLIFKKKVAQLYLFLNDFLKLLSLWRFSKNKCFEKYYYNNTHAYI